MKARVLQISDRRLLRLTILLLLGAFLVILFLFAAGYLTEQRRSSAGKEFNNITRAATELGTISQKVALLIFGALTKPDRLYTTRLGEAITSEMDRFATAKETLLTAHLENGFSANTVRLLTQLKSDGALFISTTAGLQENLKSGLDHSEAAVKFAGQAVNLLELSRESSSNILQDARHQSVKAQGLIARYYLLSGGLLLATALTVGIYLVRRLKHELSLRRDIEKSLQAANQELERFSSMVAHDLKGPLTNIQLSAQMISKHPEQITDHLAGEELMDGIMSESVRLRSMVEALLRLSHIQSTDLHIQKLILADVVERVRDSLKSQMTNKNATISQSSDIEILGDSALLHNVFQNLVENSLKYSGPTRPVITIIGESGADESTIIYEDNGVGISPELKERVFDPFFQSRDHSGKEGMGLGLAVVKKIIISHGGAIEIVEKESPGTKFIIQLPNKQPEIAVLNES